MRSSATLGADDAVGSGGFALYDRRIVYENCVDMMEEIMYKCYFSCYLLVDKLLSICGVHKLRWTANKRFRYW